LSSLTPPINSATGLTSQCLAPEQSTSNNFVSLAAPSISFNAAAVCHQPAPKLPSDVLFGLPASPQVNTSASFPLLNSAGNSLQEASDSSCSIKPIAIELCSGSARLSSHLLAGGMHVIPIDHSRNEHTSIVPNIILDLSDDCQADIISELIKSGNVDYLHAGVPCGTASRAREIRLKDGSKGPPPLRSAEHLLGLPGLSAINKLKVEKANRIYANVSRIIRVCIEFHVLITIENPKNSWLWSFPDYLKLLDLGFVDSVFQHCRWNPDDMPSRAKWQRIRTNLPSLLRLEGNCTAAHIHYHGVSQQMGNSLLKGKQNIRRAYA
jgi:hypothetical protein